MAMENVISPEIESMENVISPEIESMENMIESMQEGLTSLMQRLELDKLTCQGLRIVHFQKALIRFRFIVPRNASDSNGNWHVGAIATMIDNIGIIAAHSTADTTIVTTDYSISYYSSAKIHEEVEIEAKIIGNKGKLTSVEVKARKKDDKQLIAIGKIWTAPIGTRAPWNNRPSKL